MRGFCGASLPVTNASAAGLPCRGHFEGPGRVPAGARILGGRPRQRGRSRKVCPCLITNSLTVPTLVNTKTHLRLRSVNRPHKKLKRVAWPHAPNNGTGLACAERQAPRTSIYSWNESAAPLFGLLRLSVCGDCWRSSIAFVARVSLSLSPFSPASPLSPCLPCRLCLPSRLFRLSLQTPCHPCRPSPLRARHALKRGKFVRKTFQAITRRSLRARVLLGHSVPGRNQRG